MSGILHGKVAIVTGGASGIGLAAVRRFVAEGARVMVADIAPDGADAVADLGNDVAYVCTDVTDEDAIVGCVDACTARFGRLDAFFANAGATGDSARIDAIGPDGFNRTLALDTRSVLLCLKHAARAFRDQGGGGAFIATVSVAGLQGGWSSVSYTAAKHAVVGIIQHAAMELSADRIRVAGVAPGVIMTPLIAKGFGVAPERAHALVDAVVGRLGAKQALGRYGSAEDVAAAAAFLASDMASYISGAVLPVDGGVSAYTLSTSDRDIVEIAREFA